MLERAIISEVACAVDETVYRVQGVPAADLFEALAEAGVNVDTILQTSEEIVFSAPRADEERTAAALERLGARFAADGGLGQVSVLGAGIRSHPEVAATAFAVLREVGIEPALVSTSPIKIAAHVPLPDVERAAQALAVAFDLEPAEEER